MYCNHYITRSTSISVEVIQQLHSPQPAASSRQPSDFVCPSERIRHLSHVDRLIFCWWAFTGLVHFVIEGAFVVSPNFVSVPADKTNFLIEVCKCTCA